MIVNCTVQYLVKVDGKFINNDNYLNLDTTHIRLQLHSRIQVIEHDRHDCVNFEWENDELLKETEPFELENNSNAEIYLNFCKHTWIYSIKNERLYLQTTQITI